MQSKPPFTDVPGALDEFKAGRMIVVVDDEDRENEGDLTLAAEFVTPEAINFMSKYGRGLICLESDRGTGRLPSPGADDAAEFVSLRYCLHRKH